MAHYEWLGIELISVFIISRELLLLGHLLEKKPFFLDFDTARMSFLYNTKI